MKLYTIILSIASTYCYSQDDYQALLSTRLEEIKSLSFYDNSVVVFKESTGYGSTFDYWTPDLNYYEGDMVINKVGKIYQALADSKGKNPRISPKEWRLIPRTHPYFFLRDTAKVEDLKKLLTYNHPYVKTFAFGALAHKKINGLFKVILANLEDTTRISQMTSDYGYEVYPADLMISYELDKLSKDEKNFLKNLIETKHQHLADAKKLLTHR